MHLLVPQLNDSIVERSQNPRPHRVKAEALDTVRLREPGQRTAGARKKKRGVRRREQGVLAARGGGGGHGRAEPTMPTLCAKAASADLKTNLALELG